MINYNIKKSKRKNAEQWSEKFAHIILGPSEASLHTTFYSSLRKGNNSANIFFFIEKIYSMIPLPIAAPKFQFSFVIAHIWHPHFLPLPTLPLYKNKVWKKTPSVPCQDWKARCQAMNFTDLVYTLLNFLNFTFPCYSHHLGSQRRKGKGELAQQQCLDLEHTTSRPLNYLPSLSQ